MSDITPKNIGMDRQFFVEDYWITDRWSGLRPML